MAVTSIGTILLSVGSSSAVGALWAHILEKRRNQEIERLRSKLAESSYVSRTQYDLELASYRAIWNQMSEFSQFVNNLMVGAIYREETFPRVDETLRKELFSKGLEGLSNSFNRTLDILRESEPFIPDQIREASELVVKESDAIRTFLLLDHDDFRTNEWHSRLNDLRRAHKSETKNVRSLIRARLNEMKVR